MSAAGPGTFDGRQFIVSGSSTAGRVRAAARAGA